MSLSSETSASVKQPIRDHGFHKFLHKKLMIPRQLVQPFLIAVKIVGGLSQYRLRKQLAEEIVTSNKEVMVIPHEDGYRFFGPDDLQGIKEVVSYCTKVYQESKNQFSPEYLQKHPPPTKRQRKQAAKAA